VTHAYIKVKARGKVHRKDAKDAKNAEKKDSWHGLKGQE